VSAIAISAIAQLRTTGAVAKGPAIAPLSWVFDMIAAVTAAILVAWGVSGAFGRGYRKHIFPFTSFKLRLQGPIATIRADTAGEAALRHVMVALPDRRYHIVRVVVAFLRPVGATVSTMKTDLALAVAPVVGMVAIGTAIVASFARRKPAVSAIVLIAGAVVAALGRLPRAGEHQRDMVRIAQLRESHDTVTALQWTVALPIAIAMLTVVLSVVAFFAQGGVHYSVTAAFG